MYKFDCDGEVIEVDFETMMTQDSMGFIQLEDGRIARRIYEETESDHSSRRIERLQCYPSDALGFTKTQYDQMESDRVKHGFTDIEFKPDPMNKNFYQVHFDSYAARDRYMKFRDPTIVDKNKSSGVAMSPVLLEKAKEMVQRNR